MPDVVLQEHGTDRTCPILAGAGLNLKVLVSVVEVRAGIDRNNAGPTSPFDDHLILLEISPHQLGCKEDTSWYQGHVRGFNRDVCSLGWYQGYR